MMRRFLRETPNGATRSLSVGRHQVHDSWDQLQAYLTSTLGPNHAALFAEPLRSGNATSWMAMTEAEPVAFASLAPGQQEALLAQLDSLLAELTAFAAKQAASPRAEDRHWGALLDAIRLQPSGVTLADRLFSADGQPVLIQWGCRDEATITTDSVLSESRAVPPPGVAAAVTAAAVVAPTVAAAEIEPPPVAVPAGNWATPPLAPEQVPVPVAAGGWLLPALLWALFAATLAVIFWWLLAACALNFPPSLRLWGECRGDAITASETQRHDELLSELRQLQGGLAETAACRRAEAVEPQMPTLSEQEASALLAATDIDRAREDAGGQVGDITVTLLWTGHSDLDLIVTCPTGQPISGADNARSVCGGRIDVDANRCMGRTGGMGSVCTSYSEAPVNGPIENGFFNRVAAPSGIYAVTVRHFASAASAPEASIPFVVQIRNGENVERLTGTAISGKVKHITTFQID